MKASDAQRTKQQALPVYMGEQTDFERIFDLYNKPLRFYCEELTGANDECEELINELFTELWLKQVRFNDTEHAQAYLYRSTKNLCLNFTRDKERLLKKQDSIMNGFVEISDDPYDAFARTEVWAELYRAIENLPSQCCKVITMSYLDGMSNQEIADELSLSIQTVKNTRVRGLSLLKSKLPDNLLAILISAYLLK